MKKNYKKPQIKRYGELMIRTGANRNEPSMDSDQPVANMTYLPSSRR